MIIISKHLQTPKTFWMSVVLLSLLFLEYLKTPQGNQRIKWPSWPPEGRGRAASAAANYCNPPQVPLQPHHALLQVPTVSASPLTRGREPS